MPAASLDAGAGTILHGPGGDTLFQSGDSLCQPAFSALRMPHELLSGVHRKPPAPGTLDWQKWRKWRGLQPVLRLSFRDQEADRNALVYEKFRRYGGFALTSVRLNKEVPLNKFSAAAAMIAGLMVISGESTARELKCNGCSEVQYQNLAKSQQWGEHYVYDLVNANVRKYKVEREPNWGGTYLVFAIPQPVESEVNNAILELSAYYAVTSGGMSSYFTFDAGQDLPGMSAYDVVGPGPARTNLYNWVLHATGFQNALPMAGAALHSLAVTVINIFKSDVGATHITILFEDGTQVTLEFEPINASVAIIDGTAVDSEGNIIPATLSDLDGMRFDYSRDQGGRAHIRMNTHLNSLFGIRIRGGAKWACTSVPTGTRCVPT